MLLDLLAGKKMESELLLAAVKAGIVSELTSDVEVVPIGVLIDRCTKRLHDGFSIRLDRARWAVEMWATALGHGVTPGPDPDRATPGHRRNRSIPTATGGGPPSIIVAKLGPHNYHSIGEALAAAQPGGRIVIRPGIYDESLTLTKAVELVGDGDLSEVVLQNTSGNACLTMAADYAAVRNLTIRGRSTSSRQDSYSVKVTQGRLILEDCIIVHDSSHCVEVRGHFANPVMRHCTLRPGDHGVGLLCADGAEGLFHACVFERRSSESTPKLYSGHIEIHKSGDVAFSRCHIADSSGNGVTLKNTRDVHLTGCRIGGNAFSGVAAIDSTFHLTLCVLEGNKRGVTVTNNARGFLDRCEVIGNSEAGISADKKCEVALHGCMIRDGVADAITVADEASLLMDECKILRNGSGVPTVRLTGASRAKVSNTVIHECGTHCLIIGDKASAELIDSDICVSDESVIRVYDRGVIKLSKCRVLEGNAAGLTVSGKASVDVRQSEINAHAEAGVEVESGASAMIYDSLICNNGYEGIWVKEGGVATVGGCDLSANERGPVDAESGSVVTMQGNSADSRRFPLVKCTRCDNTFEVHEAGEVTCPAPGCHMTFMVDEDGNKVDYADDGDASD
jgi:F-box protein 11